MKFDRIAPQVHMHWLTERHFWYDFTLSRFPTWRHFTRSLTLHRFKMDRDEIGHKCSVTKCALIDWVFDATVSRWQQWCHWCRKLLSPRMWTQSIWPGPGPDLFHIITCCLTGQFFISWQNDFCLWRCARWCSGSVYGLKVVQSSSWQGTSYSLL